MNKKDKLKQIIHKYGHAWVLLYAFIYMPWFMYLEGRPGVRHFIIHSPLDDHIPFVEYFIVPYLLWFAFIAVVAGYFFFTDKKGFYQLAAFLCAGMTLFLIICTVFPNGLHLRPHTFVRDNIFTDMVRMLYRTDTPTNVLPSIHVFNSIGAVIAISHSRALKKYKKIRYSAYIMAFLIILSTMFLKQHSVTDVIAAFAMACIIYPFVYAAETRKAARLSHQPI
ncbi:phosphatase PAP2 family protein [Lachnospiraceae bacterium 42-17]